MKRRENPPVEMPERTTVKKAANGTVYVYYTTRAYRNAQGRPTSDEAAIGKLADDGVRLIPNQRYYEFFPHERPAAAESKAFGASGVLHLLAERLGIKDLLQEACGGLAGLVLLAAAYMVEEDNVMCHIADYCDEAFTPGGLRLDSQSTSGLFAALSMHERSSFLSSWVRLRQEEEYIAYDVTSLSTYSGGIEDAEWGHNRDGEDLCQVNLGMFVGENSRLPVYYATYQGSVLDKTHLSFMMESARALGISKARFVFDRGFVTTDNLSYVQEHHLSFITALPAHLKAYKGLLDEAAQADISSSRNAVSGQGLYAVRLPVMIGDAGLHAHVFFSPQKRALEELALYAKVEKLEAELTKMASARKLPKKYTDLFCVSAGDGASETMTFARDYAKIDAKLRRAGFFVLVATDNTISSEEALMTYRHKDSIEKAFSGMKNFLDFNRMRTHGTLTTDGKLFVGFIALILRSQISAALSASNDKDTKRMPVTSAIRELKKLKRITYSSGEVQYTVVTRTQRLILDALKVDSEDLLAVR